MRKQIDELLRICRDFYATNDEDLLPAANDLSFKISEQYYGITSNWLVFIDLAATVARLNKPNEAMYKMLEGLDITITEDK